MFFPKKEVACALSEKTLHDLIIAWCKLAFSTAQARPDTTISYALPSGIKLRLSCNKFTFSLKYKK